MRSQAVLAMASIDSIIVEGIGTDKAILKVSLQHVSENDYSIVAAILLEAALLIDSHDPSMMH